MRLSLSQIRKGVVFFCFLLFAGWVGFQIGQKRIEVSLDKSKCVHSEQCVGSVVIKKDIPVEIQKKVDFSLFWQVWQVLEDKHLNRKDFDYQKLVNGAISGMTAAIGDPYTVFLPPAENKETKEDLRGDFEGVGIQIGYDKESRLSVVAPIDGSPAQEAGLKSGDLITKIKDEANRVDKDTAGISLPEAVSLIRGKKGTKVALTIIRKNLEKPFEVSLKRDTIVVKSVTVDLKENNGKTVAVLKLSRFGERTYQEWEEAITKIKNQKSEIKNFGGIVLDLRNNPGGFLQGAVYIAGEFLSSGVVVQQDSGVNGKDLLSVDRVGNLLKDKLVVLVNEGSASASEIVAGALQEYKRGTLVGMKSFGKGTVQEALDLENGNGAGLHVTVSRWLLPSGKTIDKDGVKPDIEVKPDEKDLANDLQLKKALEVLTN